MIPVTILTYFFVLVISEKCEHQKYWGTRQQLLAGKVIADWLETKYGCLDPIFGVLMNPTAGGSLD